MPALVHFFRCIARAAVKNGGKALCSIVPLGEVVFEIARDAYDDYRKDHAEYQLRADLEQVVQATQAEVRLAAEQASTEEANQEPPEVQQAIAAYLGQIPASARQALRRPADPGGTTLPATLLLRKPEDLLPFLPVGLPRFRVGDRPLAADWELVEMLGKGGFGEVWKARHLHQSRKKPVALKFCLDPISATTLRNEAHLHDLLDRIREEVAVPGIVPLVETFFSNDPPCLMYEFIEGGDLKAWVSDMHARGQMNSERATRIVQRLACIVALAHRLVPPLVHRDLKMSNILVRHGAEELPELFVADFGIGGLAAGRAMQALANQKNPASATLPTVIRGAYTPLYASPQQIAGAPPDPRDDVHALGILWYQLVSGDLGSHSIPTDWREEVAERGLGADQIALLAGCIASRAERRPENAEVMSQQLAALLAKRDLKPEERPPALNAPPPEPSLKPAVSPRNKQVKVEDNESADEASADNLRLVIGSAILGGLFGLVVGSLMKGLAGALIGALPGWFLGCGVGYIAGYMKKLRRKRVLDLISTGKQLRAAKKDAEALQAFRKALALDSTDLVAHHKVAMLLLYTDQPSLKNPNQALYHAQKACGASGNLGRRALRLLARIHASLQQHDQAIGVLECAFKDRPGDIELLNSLAWNYATCPESALRNGLRAVELATAACEKTRWEKWHIVDTLAAAYAEAGRFDDAIRWQQKVVEQASEDRKNNCQSRLDLYTAGEPYREYEIS